MNFIFDPLFVLAILCLNIVLSEWLVQKTFCRHFGTALLVILMTAVTANLGLIPSASDSFELYNAIFTYVAPIAIFYLLLEVNLRDLKQAGVPMLLIFGAGTLGTVLGVLIGMWAVNGSESFGDLFYAIGGMFTGTYTGGSINFNAVALHYGVMKQGNLYAGSVVVDNIITTLWMLATIALPKILSGIAPRSTHKDSATVPDKLTADMNDDSETLAPLDLGMMLSLGAFVLWVSNLFADSFAKLGVHIPSILILTTIALGLAQIPAIKRIHGSRLLGMVSVYLFLAVIGAYCELSALAKIGSLGMALLWFATILCLVHGLVVFGLGALFRQDWDLVSIASQANIGGSTSALALSRSLGRADLFLPAILVGSLGNGVGTYLGFFVSELLRHQ